MVFLVMMARLKSCVTGGCVVGEVGPARVGVALSVISVSFLKWWYCRVCCRCCSGHHSVRGLQGSLAQAVSQGLCFATQPDCRGYISTEGRLSSS